VKIIDFPIKDDGISPIRGKLGLFSPGEINDGQTGLSEEKRRFVQLTPSIRTTVEEKGGRLDKLFCLRWIPG
jgi:hypothetical protein